MNSTMTMKEIAERIINDFQFFCRICLTIPARNWKVIPEDSEIIDIPFILSEHQEDYIKYIQRKDISDKVVLKTRQRGYSVVTLAYVLWKTLYGNNENIVFATHKADTAKEAATLVRRMFDKIPEIFKPSKIQWRAQPDRVDNNFSNNHLLIKTAVKDLARGGTITLTVLDEVGAWEEIVQKEIAASLTSSCPNNRIWISTPRKENDMYHEKVKESEADGTLFKHEYEDYWESWFGTKEVMRAWRKKQEKGLTPVQIIRELDCGFKGAVEDTIWYIEPSMFKTYRGNQEKRVIVALDLGWSDETAILWARDYGKVIHVFDELIVKENTIPQVAGRIRNQGHQLKYGVCDSSGKKTDQTSGVSSWKQLERLLQCRFRTKKFPDKIEMLRIANREMLNGRVVIDSEMCPFLTECFYNYEWKNDKIPHDKFSHIHDSFVYLIYNWLKMPTGIQKVKFRSRTSMGISR